MARRTKVLLVADAITLAHLARPAALAAGLDPERYEVSLAYDPRLSGFIRQPNFAELPLQSMSSARFLANAARGAPLYDVDTLRRYVKADLAVLDSLRPDVVIGDHRLSLSVSARRAGVPYLALINAYWSPYTVERRLLVPELPMTRILGVPIAQRLFRAAWPIASAIQSAPLNRVRKENGLPSLGSDWFSVYTDADQTLYVDAAELVPTQGLPASHRYIGPVMWSPDVGLPAWWAELPLNRPLVYATMGSSGRPGVLEMVLEALADCNVSVIATTAGKSGPSSVPANAWLVDYAPGDKLAARADLMICNGGSLTVYQSLAAGKPVLGVAAHMDQQLSMSYVESAGVGRSLRSDTLNTERLRSATERLLSDASIRRRAQTMAGAIAGYDPVQRLSAVIDEVVHG